MLYIKPAMPRILRNFDMNRIIRPAPIQGAPDKLASAVRIRHK
jgi:hypothetical protein